MEAEARAIPTDAVREPADAAGLFTALMERFGAVGGVELELPPRGAAPDREPHGATDPWTATRS